MTDPARLVFPGLRWRDDTGFRHEQPVIDQALDAGVGGFCLFGGSRHDVEALTDSLRRRSRHPLLIASDLERGAGQQFPGAASLPPLGAIGSLDDVEVTRRAAALTAAQALAVGVNWIYAPVADVRLEPRNPIVGTRAFGDDPAHVARHVAAWVRGCRDAGALCCAKHFPGHGRTTEDSHAALPRVRASAAELEQDLLPFRAAVNERVDSMMTAHVIFDAFDGAHPATFSATVLNFARRSLGFEGLLVSDALNMQGALDAAGGSEAAGAEAALAAGCDALLYPDDPMAVVAALREAAGTRLPAARVADALARVARAAERGEEAVRRAASGWWPESAGPAAEADAWADDVALRCMVVSRGTPACAAGAQVHVIDDDVGGPWPPPSRSAFAATLRRGAAAADSVLIALFSDVRAWKGAPGVRAAAREQVEALLAAHPDATLVLFGHPALAHELPGRHILSAWGGEAVMQRAAAHWLNRREP